VSGSSTKSTRGLSSNTKLQLVPSASQLVTVAVTPKNILNPSCFKNEIKNLSDHIALEGGNRRKAGNEVKNI
jgi:hypothetical protein